MNRKPTEEELNFLTYVLGTSTYYGVPLEKFTACIVPIAALTSKHGIDCCELLMDKENQLKRGIE